MAATSAAQSEVLSSFKSALEFGSLGSRALTLSKATAPFVGLDSFLSGLNSAMNIDRRESYSESSGELLKYLDTIQDTYQSDKAFATAKEELRRQIFGASQWALCFYCVRQRLGFPLERHDCHHEWNERLFG